jgi:hypothetical protein
MSDYAKQTAYHVACAIQLATDIIVDLDTFLRLPAPYSRLFVLLAPEVPPDAAQEGAQSTGR